MRPHATLSLLLVSTIAPAALSDTIYTVDGDLITEVRIEAEGLEKVTYKDKRKDGEISSEKVVRVEYDRMPELVDTALTAVRDGQFMIAIEDLENYLREVGSEGDRRYGWAPAYAMWRLVELYGLVGNPSAVVAWSERLIERAPDSRYLPMAYLAKAQTLFDGGKGDEARETVNSLGQLVRAKSLSKRWELEQELHRVLFDEGLKGSARRSALEDLVATTSEFPTVSNRAYVAVGESLVEGKKYEDARKVFQEITDSAKADGRTLAAAYCGLGECLFAKAATSNDNATLEAAVMALMRVPVTYPEEARYVPRALFYAGRSYQLMTGPQEDIEEYGLRAGKLYRAILRDYPDTRWAQEARNFR